MRDRLAVVDSADATTCGKLAGVFRQSASCRSAADMTVTAKARESRREVIAPAI